MAELVAVLMSLVVLLPTIAAVGLSVWTAVRWYERGPAGGPSGAWHGPAWSVAALIPAALALSVFVVLDAYDRAGAAVDPRTVYLIPATATAALLLLGGVALARPRASRPSRPRGPATPAV